MIAHSRLLQRFDYDKQTGIFTRKTTGKTAGWENGNGYLGIYIDGRRYYAHRLAWFYVYGQWPNPEIDHINLNRSDNRIENLREATRSQNSANGPRHSRLKGATFCKQANRWRAQICYNYKNKHLGFFASEEEAHSAYMVEARRLFGEFARAE